MNCNTGYQEHKYDIEVSTSDEGQFPNVSNRSIVRLYEPLKATFEFGIQIQDVKTHESYCLLCSLFADMFIDLKYLSP